MSQPSNLNIYFVLPEEDNDAECSKDMVDAFNCVKQYKGKPKWVKPSFIMSHRTTLNDVFVFEKFAGKAFEVLKLNSAKILGAKCMLTCMAAGETIPPGISPVFTEGMRGLIVCCTGFDGPAKAYLQEKIQYMGGVYDSALRTVTTHVVAANNITAKALQAYAVNKPIMKKEWIDAVWDRSQVSNVRGNHAEFNTYESPLFHNLEITTSGIPRKEKEKLKELISYHGGQFSGEMREHRTHILLLNSPSGEKFKAAKSWNVKCLKPEWIHKCVETGKVVALKDFFLEKVKKVSTPVKGEVDLTTNFSMMSAIGCDDRNFTHVEESNAVGSILSQATPKPSQESARKSSVTEAINCILSKMSDAGTFLDGCNVFLSGFNQEQFEKLKKVLNYGGATRFDELNGSVTHVIVASILTHKVPATRAHILPLDWLSDSADLKKPAPLDKYVLLENPPAQTAPPSPLSKQGALLLNRGDSIVGNVEWPPAEVQEENNDDLMMRYSMSRQADPLPPPQPAAQSVSNLSQSRSCRSESTVEKGEIFRGLKFHLSQDLTEEELVGGEEVITACGGIVVPKKFHGVPDYAVVPVVGASLQKVTAKEVVTLYFIKDCYQESQLLEPQYFHSPITWKQGSTPLLDCVISVSRYVGSEKAFVEALADILGSKIQAILAKIDKGDIRKTTHLICPEPEGQKYNGALRWGLPVVHHDWLLKCAELGIRVSEKSYLIGDSKLSESTAALLQSKTEQSNETPTAANREQARENSNAAREQRSRCATPLLETSRVPQNSPFRSELRQNSVAQENYKELNNSTLPLGQQNRPETPIMKKAIQDTTACKLPQESPFRNQLRPLNIASSAEPPAPSPVNKAIERLKQFGTPQGGCSPDGEGNRTMTPTSPYGAFNGNPNPSPATRKRLYKWMNGGADFPLDPPVEKPGRNRRNSTPVSEVISRHLKMFNRRPEDQPPDDSPLASPSPRHSPAVDPAFDVEPFQGKRLHSSIADDDRRWINSAAKRPHLSTGESSQRQDSFAMSPMESAMEESTNNDLLTGLMKMQEIEASYSKTNEKPATPPTTSLEEPKMTIVAESQPHTEIGWDDPSEKYVEKCVEEPTVVKTFMISGLADTVEVLRLIEKCGGKTSNNTQFNIKATHLIASSTMTRAEKLMGSIVAGLWILHPLYLEKLEAVGNVNDVNEEEFEWGGSAMEKMRQNLTKVIRDCVEIGHEWRKDIHIYKRPRAFEGMKIILNLAPSKCDSFARLVEGGGGEIVTTQTAFGDKVFAICDPSKPRLDMEGLARRKIKCVTMIFINDIIQRKPGAIEENYVPGFIDIWNAQNHS